MQDNEAIRELQNRKTAALLKWYSKMRVQPAGLAEQSNKNSIYLLTGLTKLQVLPILQFKTNLQHKALRHCMSIDAIVREHVSQRNRPLMRETEVPASEQVS